MYFWTMQSRQPSDRSIDIADAGDLDTPVPSCPAWAMRDLVAHVATRPEIWLAFSALGPDADPDMEALQRLFLGGPSRPDPELFDWVRAEHRRFRAEVISLGLQRPIWFFGRDLTVAYLAERATLEMAAHAWDAEAIHGRPAPVDPLSPGWASTSTSRCPSPYEPRGAQDRHSTPSRCGRRTAVVHEHSPRATAMYTSTQMHHPPRRSPVRSRTSTSQRGTGFLSTDSTSRATPAWPRVGSSSSPRRDSHRSPSDGRGHINRLDLVEQVVRVGHSACGERAADRLAAQ